MSSAPAAAEESTSLILSPRVVEESVSTSSAPGAVEEFARHGDVVLHVSERRFLVWSGALRLASPVFAAMFDGRFAEGQALSAASPPEIALPGDDATAMSVLCNITHMRTADVDDAMDMAGLIKLALLADKYDCVHILHPWARIWVTKLMLNKRPRDLERILVTAYILDLAEEFFQTSQAMIRDTTEPPNIVAALETGILPLRVMDQITQRRFHVQKHTQLAFDRVVENNEQCDIAYRNVGVCLRRLRDKGVRLSGIPSESMRYLKHNDFGAELGLQQNCGNARCACRRGLGAGREIMALVCNLYDAAEGLCLDCVRLEESGLARACRVSHRFPCYRTMSESHYSLVLGALTSVVHSLLPTV